MKTHTYKDCESRDIVIGGQYYLGELVNGNDSIENILHTKLVSPDNINAVSFVLLDDEPIENSLNTLVAVWYIFWHDDGPYVFKNVKELRENLFNRGYNWDEIRDIIADADYDDDGNFSEEGAKMLYDWLDEDSQERIERKKEIKENGISVDRIM